MIFITVGLFWQPAGVDLVTETFCNTMHAPEETYLLNS